MTAPHASEIIDGYLARLELEADDLPRPERQDLIDGVREHIAEARAEMAAETDADLLNLLERIGDPVDLVDAGWDRLDLDEPEPVRVGLLEIAALILTPLIWPIGVILLWTSNAWNTRDKLIGTLVPPGGLFTSLMVFFIALAQPGQSCSGGSVNGEPVHMTCTGGLPGIEAVIFLAALLVIVFLPVLTGIYMGTQLRSAVRSTNEDTDPIGTSTSWRGATR